MSKTNIQVSIIMATYNRAHFIAETLLSIQNQTFQEWECHIIDDGGTDNTAEVIQPILEKDTRFSFHKRPEQYQKGLPGCRNFGLDLAQGQYIIFFDDDDIVHPQNLECCVAEFSNPDIAFCRYQRAAFTGDFEYQFDYAKDYTKFAVYSKDVEKMLTYKLPFNSCAVMWRKSCFNQNRFVESLMFAEEWELYSRILSSGVQGVSINKTLFFGRKHYNSNTGEFSRRNEMRVVSKKEAVLLIVDNLHKRNMMTSSLLRFFVQMALGYKKYHLFSKILSKLDLSLGQQIYWRVLYAFLPLRLSLNRLKKKLIK
jgi:glycosyltransferase involved in cell wall biosynthesis